MSLILNGDTGVSKVQSGVVEDGDLVNAPYKMVLGTAVTASGTSVDFTGIPSWAKRITVMFSGVSTNGTSIPIIQLGDSGGVETTGYIGNADNGSGAGVSFTTGLGLERTLDGTTLRTGHAVFTDFGTNKYIGTWVGRSIGTTMSYGATEKTLSATLDRIRITTVNGTDLFDAGIINIIYEG